jgi:hypothetical protein
MKPLKKLHGFLMHDKSNLNLLICSPSKEEEHPSKEGEPPFKEGEHPSKEGEHPSTEGAWQLLFV